MLYPVSIFFFATGNSARLVVSPGASFNKNLLRALSGSSKATLSLYHFLFRPLTPSFICHHAYFVRHNRPCPSSVTTTFSSWPFALQTCFISCCSALVFYKHFTWSSSRCDWSVGGRFFFYLFIFIICCCHFSLSSLRPKFQRETLLNYLRTVSLVTSSLWGLILSCSSRRETGYRIVYSLFHFFSPP